jgi:hypothetical protein
LWLGGRQRRDERKWAPVEGHLHRVLEIAAWARDDLAVGNAYHLGDLIEEIECEATAALTVVRQAEA